MIDWNGNGLADLVAVDGSGRYALYRRFRADDGTLALRKERQFVYDDGETVTHDSIPRETSGTDAIVVCDWRGLGVWDLLVGTCYAVFHLANLGANAEPVFARPQRLALWGETIRHSRHGLNGHAVDWDGDGRLSWVAGTESGMVILFRRAALEAKARPRVSVRPAGCSEVEDPGPL